MFDLPQALSPAHLEAQTILTHILSQISSPDSKYYPKYGTWVERHPNLPDFCLRTIRPQVWTFLQNRWSLDALKLISGDLRFEGRALYLNGVLGLDKRLRIYIGQSNNLRQRVAQHLNFRYRRDNPSLHYHALQYSIYNTIGVLAVLPPPNVNAPGMDAPDLLQNVLEMWLCLLFRSLPQESLEEWLPHDGTIKTARKEAREGVVVGLNIALPLDQGEKSRNWVDLSESEDALVREYLETGKKSSGVHLVRKEKEEEDVDTPVMRRKAYAKKARGYRGERDTEISVSPWLVLGGMAVVAGLFLLSSKGGSQPKGWWR
jgi:hypothetical protein